MECREPESRPASPESRPPSPESQPESLVCTSRRVPCQRPPPVPGTHSMILRPSTAPQRVPQPSPPASSLLDSPDPDSDSLRAASPTVTRFLATVVTDPSFESTTASALIAKLVDFAAACRLDYATSLIAEFESVSVCPPSVGGECALGTDVLEDRQTDVLQAEVRAQTNIGGFGKPSVKDRLMCHVSKNIADPSGHDIWHTVLQAATTTDPGNIYERCIMDRTPPKNSWSNPTCGNRVALMGDAAHNMHTGPGQGAHMAFEDAHQLSMCLTDVKDVLAEPATVAAVVREYEARRIDRCVRVHAYATGSHGFGDEGKLVKALSLPEKMKRFMEFKSWVHSYPDKIKGDLESTHFK
ncbi:unnamed protein product [Closterium sp. NIES-54]